MKKALCILLTVALCLLLLLPGCGKQETKTILIPAEAVSQARALFLLQEAGVITLRDGAALQATTEDIDGNPYGVTVQAVPSEKFGKLLPEAALAVMGPETAYAVGLDPRQVLQSETGYKAYPCVIAMRGEDATRDVGRALAAAAQSDVVAEQIKYTFGTLMESATESPGSGTDPNVDYADLLNLRLTVAAYETPQAEILQVIGDVLRAQDIQLEVKLYTDPAQANADLIAERVDAVYMQDAKQLEAYNIAHGATLLPVAAVHAAPLSLYAGTAVSVDALAEAE
ncbi:MAG: hypothetical protein IJK64_10485 [Clostridia bacterium]|nr:hypothetical protein [Clostridia bacterium]